MYLDITTLLVIGALVLFWLTASKGIASVGLNILFTLLTLGVIVWFAGWAPEDQGGIVRMLGNLAAGLLNLFLSFFKGLWNLLAGIFR